MKDDKWKPYDLSIPEAQHYLRRAIRRVIHEWGYKLIKVDFAYLNMGPTEFYDKTFTSADNHRLGWKILKEEAGEDVFVFGIGGPIGLHYGIINGERITLDTLPRWHPKNMAIDMLDIPQTGGSVFFNYRTMARRYYLNNRVWFNHLDCFSFRPTLTRNEAMMLITSTAMLGGIWKIGDKLTMLKDEDFGVIRKILPIHRFHARPLDMFENLLPQVFHLKYLLGEEQVEQNIVAIMNWSPNRNIITGEEIPEGDQTFTIPSYDMPIDISGGFHVFDFWEEKYLGKFDAPMQITLEKRSQKLLAIQEDTGRPIFLSTNRHITQGHFTFESLDQISSNNEITGVLNLIPNYTQRLYFYVPPNYRVEKMEVGTLKNISHKMIENRILVVEFNKGGNNEDLIKKASMKITFSD